MASNFRVIRKVRQGKIEIASHHPCELKINFAVEIVNVDESGRVLNVIEGKEDSTIVPIDTQLLLGAGSRGGSVSVASIAAEVINTCKYVHPSRVEEVEQILIKLRKLVIENREKEVNTATKGETRVSETITSAMNKQQRRDSSDGLPAARLDDIDDYLELLYQVSTANNEEGLQSQIRGTAMILKLCRNVMNLEHLIHNSTLMGALARVLQEEYKKSTELTFNILRIFLAFSNFMEMHSMLADYRIGLFTLKTIEFELKRAESRDAETADKTARYERELHQVSNDNDLSNEESRQRREALKKKMDAEAAKHRKVQLRQDKILIVGFYLLLNLAEDLSVEKKMIKKDVIKLLAGCLERSSVDLLLLVITFLKKISVFEDNKDSIKRVHESGGVKEGSTSPVPSSIKPVTISLCRLVSCNSIPLVGMTLRMLFNLSFDKDLRGQMITGGLLPKVVSQLKVPSLRSRLLKLLYHLTMEEKSRAMFSYTDGIPILLGMIVNFPQKLLAKELAALGINLTLHPKNVEQIVEHKGLSLLMDRLISVEDIIDDPPPKDPLLMKIIRNISMWTYQMQQSMNTEQYSHRGLWTPHIKTLVRIALEAHNNHDLLVEIFGTLSNLTSSDLPANQTWAKLLNSTSEVKKDMNLLDLINRIITSGTAIQDMILETLLLISTISEDSAACKIIAKSSLLKSLFKLWLNFPATEVEIHLQLLFCFYNFSSQPATQEACFTDTKILNNVIDYLSHKNESLRSLAYEICGRVAEFDRENGGNLGELGQRIRLKRFEYYNQLWVLETHHFRDAYDDFSIDNAIRRSPTFDGGMQHEFGEDSDDFVYTRMK